MEDAYELEELDEEWVSVLARVDAQLQQVLYTGYCVC